MVEIAPRHYIAAGLVFFLLIGIVVYSVTLVQNGEPGGDGSDRVQNFMDQDAVLKFNQSMQNYDSLASNINTLQTQVNSILKPGSFVGVISLPVLFIQTGWQMLVTIFSGLTFMNTGFSNVLYSIGIPIPAWIITMIGLLVGVFVVFTALSIIFGKDI